MTRWLVMPRGINVGKTNRILMAKLRTVLEELGFDDVVTVGQSGNIVVTGNGSEDRVCSSVQAAMVSAFNVDVPVVVRSDNEVRQVLATNPLQELATDGSKYLAIFMSKAPSQAQVTELLSEDLSPEVVRIIGRTAFVWTPDGVKTMRVSHAALEKRFGVTATARNWNTLQKIATKF